MSSKDNVAEALFNALCTADEEELKELKKELDAYKGKYFGTYRIVRQRQPFSRAVLDSMDEALEFMLDHDSRRVGT